MQPLSNILKPQFEHILENESQYSIAEVHNAKKDRQREEQQAEKMNMTVEQYRLQNQLNLKAYSDRMKESDALKEEMENMPLDVYGKMVMKELHYSCNAKGSKFKFVDDDTREKYREVIRYMHGSPTEIIDSNKFLYMYGRYGNGKSLLLKSCYSVLNQVKRLENNWSYFHIPTFVNKAISDKSIKVFDVIFNCQTNMILDEMGDMCEKQKIYGQEQIPVRQLLLDKYDKWISNNGNGQKIAITSNLFPDESFFYHAGLQCTTIHEFYDEKLLNKMKENYNMIRFPNVSYRDNNITSML